MHCRLLTRPGLRTITDSDVLDDEVSRWRTLDRPDLWLVHVDSFYRIGKIPLPRCIRLKKAAYARLSARSRSGAKREDAVAKGQPHRLVGRQAPVRHAGFRVGPRLRPRTHPEGFS
ncbi:hypothetical protein Raf01_53220 [Rugosimonospora africana]|uniref:Uncharacterized protein n=1 Tax=Rugosimonospora africana TaxID=556532 RepID=A0A8J3QWM5_9ACTN|nr:hypothetical protein Raf01_53220 [Rugosimonospora africana]